MPFNEALQQYGWDADLELASAELTVEGTEPARVAAADRGSYLLFTSVGERRGVARRDLEPATGDWVIIESGPPDDLAVIVALVPRRTKIARKVAGKRTAEQTIVANVDTVFVVTGLGADFNVRRIERYLTLGWAGGAQPVLVLTKADLCDDLPAALAAATESAIGVPIHAVSSITGEGLDDLRPYLIPGATIATIGSSGAGKSTLINAICGSEVQFVQELGWYGKGRHTTTRRELVRAPSGVLLVDTPGLREVGLWDADGGLEWAFADIERLARECRFNDCSHGGEPGCAVVGTVAAERLAAYKKLQREARLVAVKADKAAQAAARRQRRRFERSLRRDSY